MIHEQYDTFRFLDGSVEQCSDQCVILQCANLAYDFAHDTLLQSALTCPIHTLLPALSIPIHLRQLSSSASDTSIMQVSPDARCSGTRNTDLSSHKSHPATTTGYKVFKHDWTCRGFQFPFGKQKYSSVPKTAVTVVHEGPVKMCTSGFHFCQRALDCLSYYSLDATNRFAQVAASGIVITEDDKSVTNHLTLIRELSYDEFKEMCTGVITSMEFGQRHETPFCKGLKHGVETHWDGDGQIACTTTYEYGRKHGACTSWYPNGMKCAIALHRFGRLDGVQTVWHDNGQCAIEVTYYYGLQHGVRRHWLDDGQICDENNYKIGAFEGVHRNWLRLGNDCEDELDIQFIPSLHL
jgi:antitoxin component YwqK of YwqJK toxin-antitoxin module